MKVVFRRHPKDLVLEVGKALVLTTKTLSPTGASVEWEANLGKGWKVIGKGKTFTIKKAKEAHTGLYRVIIGGIASRVATVKVGGAELAEPSKDLEPTLTPTKENDSFIEILESTGTDAKQETLDKVIPCYFG